MTMAMSILGKRCRPVKVKRRVDGAVVMGGGGVEEDGKTPNAVANGR